MSLYGWHNCPAPVREQVDRVSSELSRILAGRLAGLYLHGSLAMNCFNPNHSDLDLLVVTSVALSLRAKRQIIEYLLASSQRPQPIEISFLTRAQLLPWRYPTPFDLHYSEMWRASYTEELAAGTWQAWNDEQRYDPDLAAHITVIKARGIRLAGAPIAAIFPPVPDGDFYASLAGDIHESLESIVASPVYAILNCCRTYAYLCDRRVYSKEEGGRWALQALPAAFHATVTATLAAYRSNTGYQRFDIAGLNTFATYMRQELAPILQRRAPG